METRCCFFWCHQGCGQCFLESCSLGVKRGSPRPTESRLHPSHISTTSLDLSRASLCPNPSRTPAWSFSYSVCRRSSATTDFFLAQGGGSNGRIPVSILYTVTPRDHQSTASLYPWRWSLL